MAEVLKPQLYNAQTGEPANLPENQIPQALQSGKFAFQKGVDLPVLNPDGKPGTIPSDFAHEAFSNGFQYEPAENQLDRIKTQENSGFLPGAEAFAAGAARGVSLGTSDLAMTQSGLVSPEKLADLQKYRPNWSMGGEGTGILTQSLLAPEAGFLGLVGDVGKGVTESAKVAKVLGGYDLGNLARAGSAASKMLGGAQDIGVHALGSAVEGAIYSGVGNTITEHALGDPELNGQKILSNFGYGALLGGALGGVLKSAEIGIPEALTAAKDGFTSLKNTLIGTGENDAGLIGRVLPDKISEAMANRATNLDVDQKIKLVNDTTSDLNNIHNNIETTIKKLNQDIRPQETDALIDTADKGKVFDARQTVVNQMNDAIDLMRKEPELYSQNAARKLELQRDGIVNKMSGEDSPVGIFNSLRQAKQELQKVVFSKIPTSQEIESINLLNGIQKSINSSLHDPDVFGFAGSALAAHDDMLSQYYKYISPSMRGGTDFQKAFMSKVGSGPNTRWQFDPKKVEMAFKTAETIKGSQKMGLLDNYYSLLKQLPEHLENTYANVPNERFDPEKLSNILDNSKSSTAEAGKKYLDTIKNSKKSLGLGDYMAGQIALTHPLVGAAIEAYNIATKPIEHLNKLAELERLIGKTTNAIGRGAKAIFSPVVRAAEASTNTITKLTDEMRLEKHRNLATQLTEFQSNPQSMIDKISENTEMLHGVAPDTAASVQQSVMRATQFLSSKNPIPPQTNSFSEPYEPSPMEMAKFERYSDIVEKPMRALEQVRSGIVTPETTETLMTVYPKLYDQMKQAVLLEAQNRAKKDPIPFQTKQSISMFLGSPLDKSLNPMSIQANQMAFQAAPQPNQPQAKPSKSGMGKITLAERSSINHGGLQDI